MLECELNLVIASLGHLTPREAETLLWVAYGKTSWETGQIMGVAEATANAHIASACQKLEAVNRPHLVAKAFAKGILKAGGTLVLLLSLLMNSADDGVLRRVGRIRPRRDEIILARTLAQICAGV